MDEWTREADADAPEAKRARLESPPRADSGAGEEDAAAADAAAEEGSAAAARLANGAQPARAARASGGGGGGGELEGQTSESARLLARLSSTDALMEGDVLQVISLYVKAGGTTGPMVQALADGFRGRAQMCNLMGEWLTALNETEEEERAEEKRKGYAALVGEGETTRVDATSLMQEHLRSIVVQRFDPRRADTVFKVGGERGPPEWLGELIDESSWRRLIYELTDRHKDCLFLNFAVQKICEGGHQTEIAGVASAAVLHKMFDRILTDSIGELRATVSDPAAVETAVKEFHTLCLHSQQSVVYARGLLDAVEARLAAREAELRAAAPAANGDAAGEARAEAACGDERRFFRRVIDDLDHAAWKKYGAAPHKLIAAMTVVPSEHRAVLAAVQSMVVDNSSNASDVDVLCRAYGLEEMPADVRASAGNQGAPGARGGEGARGAAGRGGGGARGEEEEEEEEAQDAEAEDEERAAGDAARPPVEYVQHPDLLRILTRELFAPGRGLQGAQRERTMHLLAYAGASGDRRATRVAFHDLRSCLGVTSSAKYLLRPEARDRVLRAVESPVAAMGVLEWMTCHVTNGEFYELENGVSCTPTYIRIASAVAKRHAAIRQRVLDFFVTVFDESANETIRTVAVKVKEHVLDALIGLIAVGFVLPVLHVVHRWAARTDQSLIRYFLTSVLTRADAPYSPAFTRALLRVMDSANTVTALLNGDEDCREIIDAFLRNASEPLTSNHARFLAAEDEKRSGATL